MMRSSIRNQSIRNSARKTSPRFAENQLPPGMAQRRHPDTVQRILRAAEENFAERGLAGARIGAIARAARVNKALLYYYFAGKEKLHRFTLTTLFRQLRQQTS